MEPNRVNTKQQQGQELQESKMSYLQFKDNILQYQEDHIFRIIRRPINRLQHELLLSFLHMLKDGLPDMNMNFLFNTVFDSLTEKILQIFEGRLVGGICINYQPKKYAKIQYMVIASQLRNKGFGSLLIHVLKRLLQTRKTALIVVNADINSEGFYKKLGFNTKEYIKNQLWQSKYENYINVIKMQCIVNPKIDYFSLRDRLQKLKQNKTKQWRKYYVVSSPFPNNLIPQNYKRKNQMTGAIEYFQINPTSLTGLYQNGWNWQQYNKLISTQQSKNFRRARIFQQIVEIAEPQLQKFGNCEQIGKFNNKLLRHSHIDLDSILKKTIKGEYQNMNEIWKAFENFFICTKYIYSKDQRIMANLQTLEAKVNKIKQIVK